MAIRVDGDRAAIDVPLEQTVHPAPDAASLAAAVGLPEPASARWVNMPLPYLLIEAESPSVVAATLPAAEAAFRESGLDMVYLYAFKSPTEVRARFFAPGSGVFEDPATGSAAVALGAALRADGKTAGRVEVSQGIEVGHPSAISLEWRGTQASIGGTVRKDEVRWLDT